MNEITKQKAGTIARQEFGGTELATSGETVATVLAARAKAEVEARFIVAMQRPRDWDDVRQKMLKACERPGFAGKATDKIQGFGVSWWSKPVGNSKIEGFSIRFAEEALRNMGNMDARSSVIWEDDTKRIVQVEVLDLENNISIPTTVIVEKTIERRFLKEGEVAISVRTNSYDEPVYLRAATDDEVMQKQNSLVSKAMRNGILRLLPGDIQSECRDRILQIRNGDIAKDPEGFKRQISDGFARHGVKPSDLKGYLGHDLASSSQAELADLRDLWQELNTGTTTWVEVIKETAEAKGESPPAVVEPEPTETLKEKLKLKNQKLKEKEAVAVVVDTKELNPKTEILAIAQDRWGDDCEAQLEDMCKASGFSSFKIMQGEEAGKLLDLLCETEEVGK